MTGQATKDEAGLWWLGGEQLDPVQVVSQTELCQILDLTDKRIMGWRREHDDFPILERGGKGVEFSFYLPDVTAWVEALRVSEEAARQARQEQIKQMRFEHLGDPGLDQADELTTAEYAALVKAELDAQRLQEVRDRHLVKADVEDVIERAFMALRDELGNLPARLAREFSLDRGDQAKCKGLVDQALTRSAGLLGEMEGLASA